MGAAVAIPMVAGSILGAVNSIQQGNAAAAQDRQNATYAGMAGADALQRGARNVGLIRARGDQVVGQQKVGYAASGVDVSSGTPAETMASTRAMSELDAAAARNNAAREAWGYQVQQTNLQRQAQLDQQRGRMAAVGSILGGAGNLAGRFGGQVGGGEMPRMGGASGSLPVGAGDYGPMGGLGGSSGYGNSGPGYA